MWTFMQSIKNIHAIQSYGTIQCLKSYIGSIISYMYFHNHCGFKDFLYSASMYVDTHICACIEDSVPLIRWKRWKVFCMAIFELWFKAVCCHRHWSRGTGIYSSTVNKYAVYTMCVYMGQRAYVRVFIGIVWNTAVIFMFNINVFWKFEYEIKDLLSQIVKKTSNNASLLNVCGFSIYGGYCINPNTFF